jgi:hypothetical protein
MNFWKKFRLLGGLLALLVGALTVASALLLHPDRLQTAPDPAIPPASTCPGGPGCNGL